MKNKITVAIDGHSSTGKSTLAKELAQALQYIYVDSGAMYRCVALYAIQNKFYNPALDRKKLISSLKNIEITFQYIGETEKNLVFLNGADVSLEIRGMQVSGKVSEVAAVPEVRRHLVALQQAMGKNKGLVMDGRDIGTVVFPDAELKIFMTASPEIRAQRRYDELQGKKEKVTFEEVLQNLKKRDTDDTLRSDSPLHIAKDAIVLDNSQLDRKKQFKMALQWAEEASAKH